MAKIVALMLVFLIGIASASSVNCTIVNQKVLVEIILTDGDSVILPEKYSLLEEKGNKVSFISEDFLRKDGEWIFVLPRVVTEDYDLKVYLPQNYVLTGNLIYPKGYDISSDGKSIILNWENVSEEVVVFYEGVESSYLWVWFLILGLGIFGFVFFKFQDRRFSRELERLKEKAKVKDKVSRSVLISRNLFGEEKRIVEFLIAKKSCWMKELVRELGISKVMCTRKVRSLIEKGIVEKENFGKENRISLRK
jgi:uncharacterized membrane protein